VKKAGVRRGGMMLERRIQIEEGSQLMLEDMAGDVTLMGWDEADVLVRFPDGGEEGITIEATEQGPALSAQVPCEVKVPRSVAVVVRQVAGNLKADGVDGLNTEQVRGNLKLSGAGDVVVAEVYGNLKAYETGPLRVVGTVYGNAELRGVPAADVQNIRGNLSATALGRLRASRIGANLKAQKIDGALAVDQVGGNALLGEIAGPLTIDKVAGNLVAKDLAGGARLDRIGGNLVWTGGLGGGHTYHLRVDGNATLRFDEGAGAHVMFRAGGKLHSSLELADLEEGDSTLQGTLGDGGAEILVEARGNVLLGGTGAAVGAELGDEISRQLEESLRAVDLEAIGRQVGEEMEAAMSRLSVKLESVDWDRIGRQAERAVEQAMKRMQRDMDRMVEKAARYQSRWEQKAEREVRRQERRARKDPEEGAWETGGSAEAVVDREPGLDLDDERLSVLRMVEQGQITPEEAEMLLDALG
jgi:hypothetical protein